MMGTVPHRFSTLLLYHFSVTGDSPQKGVTMLVKICGMMSKDVADFAAHAGADFVGLIFARSRRQISPEQAASITASIPGTTKKVGVFVNQTFDQMMQIAEKVGLDVIQLHGDEPPELAERLPFPIIKAFPAKKENLSQIQYYPCDYYLLDSPIGANRGGNGTTFDWNLLSESALDPGKVILAGGLYPGNVQEAITTTKPAGVDVSSGVETDGIKDMAKIEQFIRNAKMKG